MVPRVVGSSPICHPILKKSAETASIKTTFPRFFFMPTPIRHNPAFTKLPRPIPPHCRFSNRSPIRKNRPHLRHTKVAKSLKFSKSLNRILHRATVLVLNATPKRYIHKFRILAFQISEKSNSDCSDGGNCVRFIILETLKREIPVIREICE